MAYNDINDNNKRSIAFLEKNVFYSVTFIVATTKLTEIIVYKSHDFSGFITRHNVITIITIKFILKIISAWGKWKILRANC